MIWRMEEGSDLENERRRRRRRRRRRKDQRIVLIAKTQVLVPRGYFLPH